MAQRRFGPTNDAGVVVVEKDSEKTIIPSALGWAAYAGVLDRGPTDELIYASKKKSLIRQTGGYIPDSVLPDNARDFMDLAEGAGGLILLRVTAGNEVQAYIDLWDRGTPRQLVGRLRDKNGGSSGGKRETVVIDVTTPAVDFTDTTIRLPNTYVVTTDKWKNAQVTVTGAARTYDIISNTSEIGGGAGAVLTLASDSTLVADYGVATDKEIVLVMGNVDVWGQDKHLAAEIFDGQLNPTTEWGLAIYLNGDEVLSEPDLSMDPNSERYWVDVLNDNDANIDLEAVNYWTGAVHADRRPANHFGVIPTGGAAAKTLALEPFVVDVSNIQGLSTIGSLAAGSALISDVYRITYDSYSLQWVVTSRSWQELHTFPNAQGGIAYAADNNYSFGFTITENAPVHGEYFEITVLAVEEDEAIGGRIFPDSVNNRTTYWDVSDNDEDGITIVTGDMTTVAVDGDKYRLEYAQEFEHGYDGIADLSDQDYLDALDPSLSLFNQIAQSYGLIKFGLPGNTSATVIKALVAYAYQKNHQARLEIPSGTVTDQGAITFVEDTIGRNNYEAVTFPSWAYVPDPIRTSVLKLIPATGMIHGREAKMAQDYQGYHKAAAGIEVTFPRIKKLPTGDTELNGELLNPKGISRLIKKSGNWILWGDRIPCTDTAWMWKHQRELMSHYEHVMLNNFDWIIFAINDSEEHPALVSTFQTYFRTEWRPKRALQGDTLDEAASIKIDAENNTPATRAAGDEYADVSLWLADTVERFIIQMSKKGLSEITQ